jgi:excinuclease ABC subunit C
MLAKPSAIPRQSGCYLFRNERGTIIYVGKALTLSQRLSSYFQRESGLSQKTQALMNEARAVEWIVTPNEVDALILENELIKDNQPRYNMRLKDDKSFPTWRSTRVTPFRRPMHHAGQHVKGVRYFGPFVDVRALRVDDGRAAAGFSVALVHEAQVQLPRAHRPALPALRHRQVLGSVRRQG